MNLFHEHRLAMTRRHFFRAGAMGLGGAALASLLAEPARGNERVGGLPSLPHFAPKAKRAIYLFMNGGPSQMDLLDFKPAMDRYFDQPLPESIRMGQRL